MDINTEHDITTTNPAMAPSSCSGSEIMTPGGKEAPTSGYSSPYQLLSMRHEPLCLSLSPVPHHTFAPLKGTKWPLLSPSYAGQANPGGYVGVLPLFDPNGIRQTHGLSSQSRAGGPQKLSFLIYLTQGTSSDILEKELALGRVRIPANVYFCPR